MTSNNPKPDSTVVESFLREAKRLHRAAQSDSYARSLPILRRLIEQQVFQRMALPELRRSKSLVQRKHILNLLAIEAGFSHWAEFRQALTVLAPEVERHYLLALRHSGYPNHWFSTLAQAEEFAHSHGGYALAYGKQGVVIPVSSL